MRCVGISSMLLYEHPLSSFAQKVKIALRENDVAFEAELPESFGTGPLAGNLVTGWCMMRWLYARA